MKQARTTHPARRDLDDIWLWIARDSPANAQRFVSEIADHFPMLAAFPRTGRLCPELKPGMRRFPVHKYVIYYRETKRGVEILRVLHGARDAKRIFG